MMINFFRGIGGVFGTGRHTVTWEESKQPWKDFMCVLQKEAGIKIGLVHAKNPSMFNGATTAVTGGPWDHAFIIILKELAEYARKRFPILWKDRMVSFPGYPPTSDYNSYILPSIPINAIEEEILESEWEICINPLHKYNRKDVAMEIWSRPMTKEEIDHILFRAYLVHGLEYAITEIVSFGSILPDPNMDVQIELIDGSKHMVSLMTCATYSAYVFHCLEEIYRPKKYGQFSGDCLKVPPQEIHDYMKEYQQKGWYRYLRNCKAGK